MSSLPDASACKYFEAHSLRPEKCRKCFVDKSRHQVENNSSNNDTTTTGESTREEEGYNQTISKEQLIIELKKCNEEKGKLSKELASFAEKDEQICKYKREIEKLKLEIRKSSKSSIIREGEPDRDSPSVSTTGNDQQDKMEMAHQQQQQQLEELNQRCCKLEIERDNALEELKTLEREMEEMHDNFKEDESEQFEQVKQELDLATKNCKILQIRLNKSERQYSQLEQIKSMLERQLEETSSQQEQNPHKQQIEQQQQQQNYFTQIGQDSVKLSTNEYDQLLRDLNDTIEREKDLQEQIKYSQEEAQLKSDRLQAVEAENEVLLKKINKLTFANSRLRSLNKSTQHSFEQLKSTSGDQTTNFGQQQQQVTTCSDNKEDGIEIACDLIEQNEQLKLALDLNQSESDRLKAKLQQVNEQLEIKDNALKEADLKRAKLEQDFSRFKALRRATSFGQVIDDTASGSNSMLELKASSEQINKLEFECRQLRVKLVHSERECKQLKSQLEQVVENSGQKSRQSSINLESRQISKEGSFESNRHLTDQIEHLKTRNSELEQKLLKLTGGDKTEGISGGQMESDLLEKLKRQLDSSESELAKSKSRLVGLDLELNRVQRQYNRLIFCIGVESFEGNVERFMDQIESNIERRIKLPPESMRDSMSRQELRQALKDLDEEIGRLLVTIQAKDFLIKELQQTNSTSSHSPSEEEMQVRSLHRLLDQEKLLSNNLKIDVKNLEKFKNELQVKNRMLERERVLMEEEVDKLRQVNRELNVCLEDVKKSYGTSSSRLKELQINHEKLRIELLAMKNSPKASGTGSTGDKVAVSKHKDDDNSRRQDGIKSPESGSLISNGGEPKRGTSSDLLLMARDLSELKVKNGFLMRQLEIVREDTARQLDDLRRSNEDQTRRAVELAQIKLKENHLIGLQHLRDELNEVKQKLAASQRLVARNEEDVSSERDKMRSMERDWRRDKSNWQQRVEQLESQLTIEKRSNEYKVKEFDSLMREKERELIGVQDRYVQLERDQKRLQNKYKLLEDNSETKEKSLIRDLEAKKRELTDLAAKSQAREDEYYENCKRFNGEKATLLEALESIKRSYDEKLVECKSVRELLLIRQDQAYKERLNLQEKIDILNNQLIKLSEHETQSKLLKQQLQMQDKQQESTKREYLQLKEEKLKLKTKCDDLERRCSQYEKQELVSKASSISSSTNIFLKARNPFASSQQNSKQVAATANRSSNEQNLSNNGNDLELENTKKSNAQLVERLTSKINDQRNLINMLKQQHDETQMELKQLKLINLADKSKWQIRVNQFKSQLADCEERLLFESSNLLSSETFDNSRRKMEIKWNDERSAMQEMIKQQQAQNEVLMRDLKKITQLHDLLRLQSKQLESHNNKLSRKLIEYQQQKATEPFASRQARPDSTTTGVDDLMSRKLDDCLSSKRNLENRNEILLRKNNKLMYIIREQVEPSIEIVNKIIVALESSQAVEKNNSPIVNSDETRSTQRPLITGRDNSPSPETTSTQSPAHQRVASSPSRLSRFLGSSSIKQQDPKVQKDSLNSDKKNSTPKSKTLKRVKVKSSAIGITPTERKRLKQNLEKLSSTLGNLNSNFEDCKLSLEIADKQPERASSEFPDRGRPLVLDRYKQRGSSTTPTRSVDTQQKSSTSSALGHSNYGDNLERRRISEPYAANPLDQESYSQQSRVHWQLDCASDCDSEKSWSQTNSASSTGVGACSSSNYYKRFPQTAPSSYYKTTTSASNREQAGVSLTDYDSESSLAASDYSSYSSQRRFISGTESDSCMTTGSSKVSRKGTRSKGGAFKLRLTNTIRNISRSISGLGNTSDSELETTTSASVSRSKQQQQQQRRDLRGLGAKLGNEFSKNKNNNEGNNNNDHDDDENQDRIGSKLREIRV